ncbi:MAG: SDR family NAD(P)-dependent oxidoreductase [Ardenticatenaceae bacterium]
MTSKRFDQKVVVVTGAAHGIGQAVAIRFAAEGAHVAVNDVNQDAAQSVVNEITNEGGSALLVVADVSSKEEVDLMFDQVLEQWGTVDVLVNNAGIISPTVHFLDSDEAWWRRIIDVNLTGHYLCSHRAAHIMARKGGGAIINMSSGGASRAHRGFTAYDASKGGIEAFTRAAALDLAPYGIRVNALVPGAIDTYNMDEAAHKFREQSIPMGRMGTADDLARPALFLASDDASYMTGHCLVVDGGMLSQQRSVAVDTFPQSRYPKVEQE